MICFAAFVPHSPLLLPTIGKENTKSLQETIASMRRLSEELYVSHPEVLLTISAHPHIHPELFSVNLHHTYTIDFREFGDLSERGSFGTDLELISEIQRLSKMYQLPFSLDTDARLDYGVGIPLTLLYPFQQPVRLVPVSHATQSAKLLVQFGRVLKDACHASKKRVAIIASGDLSHALASDSPAGFHEAGVQFDRVIVQAIENMSLSQLLSIEDAVKSHAAESASRSLLVLFGMLERMQVRPEILSYEHPFGVGELVTQFHLSPV